MAVNKNKKLNKKGKRNKKKLDKFENKEWFELKIPKIRGVNRDTYGWICGNKTAKGITVEDRLHNRVATIRCGDLQKDPLPDNPDNLPTAVNLKLRIAETKNKMCYLDFHGMELTRDKTCSMMKKWVTLVEAWTDIKTTDNFVFRVFGMALTKTVDGQCKKTAYAKTSQVKRMRNRMIEIMNNELADKSTKEFVSRVLIDKCGDAFKKDLNAIFPVKEGACIRKVKLIKRPLKEDERRIIDLHSDNADMDENEE